MRREAMLQRFEQAGLAELIVPLKATTGELLDVGGPVRWPVLGPYAHE